MPHNDRAVTRRRRWLQETPTQWQKDVPVQLSARTPRGSARWALKAHNAERSVWLPSAAGAGLGEEERQAESCSSTRRRVMRAGDAAAAIAVGRKKLTALI